MARLQGAATTPMAETIDPKVRLQGFSPKIAAAAHPVAAGTHPMRCTSWPEPPQSACTAHRGRPATALGPVCRSGPTSTRGTGRAQLGDPRQDSGEKLSRDGDFRQLEEDILGVPH